MYVDTISKDLAILYLQGSQVKILNYDEFMSLMLLSHLC